MRKLFLSLMMVFTMMCSVCFAESTDEYYEAIGHGYAAEFAMEDDLEYQQFTAAEAARMDAYSNLLEQINGTYITSTTTIQNLRLKNKTVNGRVEGLIKNATVVSETFNNRGCVTVVRLPKYGQNSVAQAVITDLNPVVTPIPSSLPNTTVAQPTAYGGYTGLIIDCRGLGLVTAMCPLVRAQNNTIVYGRMHVSIDYILNTGIVSYAHEGMPQPRAGNNPLVVKAMALENHNVDIVLSDMDAQRILAENNQSHFLENCKVTFLYE